MFGLYTLDQLERERFRNFILGDNLYMIIDNTDKIMQNSISLHYNSKQLQDVVVIRQQSSEQSISWFNEDPPGYWTFKAYSFYWKNKPASLLVFDNYQTEETLKVINSKISNLQQTAQDPTAKYLLSQCMFIGQKRSLNSNQTLLSLSDILQKILSYDNRLESQRVQIQYAQTIPNLVIGDQIFTELLLNTLISCAEYYSTNSSQIVMSVLIESLHHDSIIILYKINFMLENPQLFEKIKRFIQNQTNKEKLQGIIYRQQFIILKQLLKDQNLQLNSISLKGNQASIYISQIFQLDLSSHKQDQSSQTEQLRFQEKEKKSKQETLMQENRFAEACNQIYLSPELNLNRKNVQQNLESFQDYSEDTAQVENNVYKVKRKSNTGKGSLKDLKTQKIQQKLKTFALQENLPKKNVDQEKYPKQVNGKQDLNEKVSILSLQEQIQNKFESSLNTSLSIPEISETPNQHSVKRKVEELKSTCITVKSKKNLEANTPKESNFISKHESEIIPENSKNTYKKLKHPNQIKIQRTEQQEDRDQEQTPTSVKNWHFSSSSPQFFSITNSEPVKATPQFNENFFFRRRKIRNSYFDKLLSSQVSKTLNVLIIDKNSNIQIDYFKQKNIRVKQYKNQQLALQKANTQQYDFVFVHKSMLISDFKKLNIIEYSTVAQLEKSLKKIIQENLLNCSLDQLVFLINEEESIVRSFTYEV